MGQGLPNINIKFEEQGVSAIQRSGRGIVALILKDDTPSFATKSYKRFDQVDKEDFTEENLDLLLNTFLGTPSEVIVEVIASELGEVSESLARLKTKRFNYLAMPSAETEEKSEIMAFIKSSKENEKKTYKAILGNSDGDDECIINFTTENIVVGEKTYSAGEFTARMAGILAGVSLDRSATYYVIPEVDSVEVKTEPDESIKAGELILLDDGEKIKLGRAVNSLITTTTTKGKSFKKIKIVEGIHLMQDDIRNTFEDNYVGKYINNYDNKVLFTVAVNAYFEQLERDYILDQNWDNRAEVSLDAQRLDIEGRGITTDGMSEQDILEYNTGSNVFVDANVFFVDAMEDLEFNVMM